MRQGFKLDQVWVGISSWVDNCFTFGSSLQGAIDIQESFEQALVEDWGLSIKEGSRSCMAPAGSQEVSAVPEKWPVVRLYGVLGHHISDTGAIRRSWILCEQNLWRALFLNL